MHIYFDPFEFVMTYMHTTDVEFVLSGTAVGYAVYAIQTRVTLDRGLCLKESDPLSKHAFFYTFDICICFHDIES